MKVVKWVFIGFAVAMLISILLGVCEVHKMVKQLETNLMFLASNNGTIDYIYIGN